MTKNKFTGCLFIELENTLLITYDFKNSTQILPHSDILRCIESAKRKGVRIVILSTTMKNNVVQRNEISKILKKFKVPFDDILFLNLEFPAMTNFISDRNLDHDEFIFKFTGPYNACHFDVVVPFYNDERMVELVHRANKKIEHLVNVRHYIYVNNGSTDNTHYRLKNLAKSDHKIKVIDLPEYKGIGAGYKAGFLASEAELIMTNIPDTKFDLYTFFYTNMKDIKEVNAIEYNIFSDRKCRFIIDVIIFSALRYLLTVLCFRYIRDFQGEPKIINKKDIEGNIAEFPDDENFNLKLYLSIEEDKKIYLPIIQKDSDINKVEWQSSLKEKAKIFLKYLNFGLNS